MQADDSDWLFVFRTKFAVFSLPATHLANESQLIMGAEAKQMCWWAVCAFIS